MAVSDAIGTQRQFTTQPQDPYNRRLRPLRVPVGDYSGAMGDAAALANSLGILGGAIINETAAREERRKQYADLSKHIINEATPDDMEKLRSIEILNKYHPDYNLSDNPYAVANVERAKGQMLTARVKSEFENDTTIYNTYEEAVNAFEDNLREARDEYAGQSDNLFAFDDGVFATHVNDVIAVANKQRKDKSERIKQESIGTALAEGSGLALNSLTMPVDVWKEAVRAQANKIRTYGWDNKEVRSYWDNFLTETARSSGSEEYLDALKDIVIFSDGDNDFTIGNQISYSDKMYIAGARAGFLNYEKLRGINEQAYACQNIEELNKFYDDLAFNTDRVTFEAAMRNRPAIQKAIENRTLKMQTARAIQSAQGDLNTYNYNNWRAQTYAYMSGNQYDANGTPVGKVNVSYLKADGTLGTRQATYEDIAPFIETEISNIYADNSLSETEKDKKVCKMLAMSANRPYFNYISEQAMSELDTLSGNLPKDANGNLELPQNLTTVLRLRNSAGNFAELGMKSADLAKIDTLRLLQTHFGYNRGIEVYANAKDTLADGISLKAYEAKAGRMSIPVRFMNLEGQEVSLSDLPQGVAEQQAQKMYPWLAACGFGDAEIKNMIAEGFRQNYYEYKGAVIPRAVFEDFNPQIAKNGLDWIVETYRKNNGMDDEDGLQIYWDNTNNELVLYSWAAGTQQFDTDALINQFEYAQEEYNKSVQSKNTTLAKANKAKEVSNIAYDIWRQIRAAKEAERQ